MKFFLLLYIGLAISCGTPVFGAGTAPTTATAASGQTPDFHKTCDDVLGLADQIKQAGDQAENRATQKLSYCAAAKDSKSAAGKNGMLWKVWAGVAGVCTTACISSFTGFGAGMAPVCTGASIGGGVTDMVVTKDFMGGLTAIGGSLVGSKLLNRGANAAHKAGTGPAVGSKGGPTNWAACLSAATATMSVFSKKSASSQATQTMNENLASAAQLGEVKSAMGISKVGLITTPNNLNQNNSTTVNNRITGAPVGTPETVTASSGCDPGEGSGRQAVNCALSSDPNLPAFVNTKQFDDELKSAAGVGLTDFVDKAKTPQQAIAAATGTGLGASAASKLADLVGQAAAAYDANSVSPSDTTYAGGGGSQAGGGANEEEPNMAEMMGKLMGGLNGPAGEAAADPRNVRFANGERLPSHLRVPASADDPNFSLFDRVTYRYYFVGKRLLTPGIGEVSIPYQPQ